MRVKYRCRPSLVKTLKEEQRRLVQAHLEMPKKMVKNSSMGAEQERCTCIHRYVAQCASGGSTSLTTCCERACCPTSGRFVDTNASNTDRICTSGRTRTCSRRTSGSYRNYTTSTSGWPTKSPTVTPIRTTFCITIRISERPTFRPPSGSRAAHLRYHHPDLRAATFRITIWCSSGSTFTTICLQGILHLQDHHPPPSGAHLQDHHRALEWPHQVVPKKPEF